MPSRKRKKNVRFRGSHTHGWGAKKKHRGAGNRGGRGNAGTGKRADQKKPTILKLYGNKYFGKHGFYSLRKKKKAINLDTLSLILTKKPVKEINLNDLGYDKLLGKGKFDMAVSIRADSWTSKAEHKVKKAGGSLVKI